MATLMILLIALGALGFALFRFETRAKSDLEARFDSRVELASGFVETYIAQLAQRQAQVAQEHLTGRVPGKSLETAAAAAGLQRAIVLDDEGRLIASHPPAVDALGEKISDDYAHLASALRGKVGVSGVVPAIVEGDPVVAVAVPYDTPRGSRVFSGGFLTTDMPLEAYLETLFPFEEAQVTLLDPAGQPIAVGSGKQAERTTDPSLLSAAKRVTGTDQLGTVTRGDTTYALSAHTDSHGWTLTALVSQEELFSPLGSGWLSKGIWLLFAVVGMVAMWAVVRLSDGGRQLAAKHAEVQTLNAELDDRVARRTAELEAANHELESFAYSVSHDLRAPLRGINGFSKILSEELSGQLDESNQRFFDMIRSNAQRMQDLIDDLLRFSRLNRHPLRWEDVDLDAVVEDIRSELTHAGLAEETDWRVSSLGTAAGDPGLVKQIFSNLIENALKYSRERNPRVIEVGAEDGHDGSRIYFVRDNGVGFDEAYSHKLFGVFQRLHRAEEYEGTGVGLATVQRIVHRHNGRIWAHAKPEAGATFLFTIGEVDDR